MIELVCPDCGSSDWEVVDEEAEECVCSTCDSSFALCDAVDA